jgi:predicted transcriptional regulator
MNFTMDMTEADFSAFQKRYQKERILSELAAKATSSLAELAQSMNIKIDDAEKLLNELVLEKLVENVAAKYYKLTYEGYKYVKSRSMRQAL